MFRSHAKGWDSVDIVWGYLSEGKLHQACVPCFHAWSISVFIRDTRRAQTISYLSNSCLRIKSQLRCKFLPSSPYDLTAWGSDFLLELLLYVAIIFFPKVSFLYLSHSSSLCNISILSEGNDIKFSSHSFIHLFNKYMLSTYCKQDSIPVADDTKIFKKHSFHIQEPLYLVGNTD